MKRVLTKCLIIMIEKILKWFAKIPNDKLLHSYLVLVISLICYNILELFMQNVWTIIITVLIATTVMIWKEWYDSKHNCTHSVEVMDIVAGYLGLVLGLLLKLL